MDKSKPLMIVIIALLVLVLGAISAASFFLIRSLGKNNAPVVSAEAPVTKLTIDQIEKVPLKTPISTNLSAGHDGVEHYVKINLAIGVNNTDKNESPKMLSSLESNEMVVRDIVLGVLRSQTYEDLTVPEGQDLLKDSIKTQLQEEFNSNLIVQVYISDLAFS